MNKILEFRDARDWKQFHKPKDLAISISIEANELLECFQWKTDNEIAELINGEHKDKFEEEIADIGIYLLLLCDTIGIDVKEAINKKLALNDKKYPINKSKGNAKKYNEL